MLHGHTILNDSLETDLTRWMSGLQNRTNVCFAFRMILNFKDSALSRFLNQTEQPESSTLIIFFGSSHGILTTGIAFDFLSH